MFKQLNLVVGLAIAATLVACGGGGDSGTTTTAVEKTFPLQQIYLSYLNTSHNYTISSSALLSGVPATSTGTRASTPQKSATFENAAAFTVEETRTTTSYQPGGASITSVNNNYYNATGQRVGYTQRDAGTTTLNNYAVIQGAPAGLPVSAKINDSGSLSSLSFYSDASKKSVAANSVTSWTLKDGLGGAVALLEVKETTTGVGTTSASTIVSTDTYSIDANNTTALIKNQVEARNGLVVIVTSTDTFTGK